MDWFLKKSIKLGPLRLKLSKSGLEASLGVKGLRGGRGPRGNYVHAGRKGLYYRKSFGKGRRKTPPSWSAPCRRGMEKWRHA